ncbi:hypothetical protein QZH41_014323 [Actinostola sp. cb2023]|nr:hypothetical protein QZH41_014323 [Actinostola sp. cb2023]
MAGAARPDDIEENDTNSLLVPDLETQKNEIGELLKNPLKKGDTWYLIECHWLKQWKKYVGFDSWDVYGVGDQVNNPGPLDNTNLFKEDDPDWTLKEHLIDELYYNLVPKEAWHKLVSWYGIVENQPAIARKVVEYGMYVKHCKVEVYLIEFKLCENSAMDKVVKRQFSKADTLVHIEGVLKEIFDIPKDAETRIWNKYMRNTFELLGNKEQTVQDVGLYQGQMLVIEQKNEDGTWQRTNTKSSYSSSTLSHPGILFVNQITSSSESSTSSYASSGSFGNFKMQVGRFAPQFSGYQQQDSHELLAFLLDGLHEDLNRIKKKPYIEVEDANDQSDTVVAQEAWFNHRQRNDSIIVDIFHGQFKSTLVCPECNKISVTFDPFCYLSLPLPIKKERYIELLLIKDNPMERPMLFKVSVPKMGSISDLMEALCKEVSVQKDRLIVCDVYNHRLHKMFKARDALTQILERDDIYVYEMAPNFEDPDTITIPVYSREKRSRVANYSHSSSKILFGNPLFLTVPKKKTTFNAIYNAALNKIRRLLNVFAETTVDQEKTEECENGDVEMNDCQSDQSEHESDEELEKAYKNVTVNGDDNDESIEHEAKKSDALKSQKTSTQETSKNAHLFNLTLVNMYGTNDIQSLTDDDKPIKLTGQCYLSLDWNSKMKDKYYNTQIAEDNKEHESMNRRPAHRKNVVKLSDCIQLFLTTEKLGANDPWFCPACKKHQQAFKKLDLWSVPEVLVVHLKRFSYTSFWRDKLDALVDFPLCGLDMSDYLTSTDGPPPTYDLIAVSNHYGGMGGGHYTAYARNHEDDQWHSYDDSSVSPISENQIVH